MNTQTESVCLLHNIDFGSSNEPPETNPTDTQHLFSTDMTLYGCKMSSSSTQWFTPGCPVTDHPAPKDAPLCLLRSSINRSYSLNTGVGVTVLPVVQTSDFSHAYYAFEQSSQSFAFFLNHTLPLYFTV